VDQLVIIATVQTPILVPRGSINFSPADPAAGRPAAAALPFPAARPNTSAVALPQAAVRARLVVVLAVPAYGSRTLRAKQDNGDLVGTLSGPEDHHVAYYRHPKSKRKRGHLKGSVFNRLIPAGPLHAAAVEVLAKLLLETPHLRERLTAILEQQRRAALADAPDAAGLEAEVAGLKEQIGTVMRALTGAALADMETELQRLGTRRNAIEAQLKRVRQFATTNQRPATEVVEQAIAILADDGRQLLALPVQPLRDLVRQFVVSASVDMETKEVEFTVALPNRVLEAGAFVKRLSQSPTNPLCPPSPLRSPVDGWTQCLATVRCESLWNRGSRAEPSYACRRVAA
jgi:hypothetical protein